MSIVFRNDLFKAAGVYVRETQYEETPVWLGEIRVYSEFGDQMLFTKEYTGIKQRRVILAEALIAAAHALEEVI